MTNREYTNLCSSKEYLQYKVQFYRAYLMLCLILCAIASSLWVIKDITEHNLTGIAVYIALAYRVLPALAYIPVIYLIHKGNRFSTFFINIVIWITIVSAFLGIHMLSGPPYYYVPGIGWIAYYIMFYAFSLTTHLSFIFPVNVFLLSAIILISEKTGWLACSPSAATVTSTGIFISIPLGISIFYFKRIFAGLYVTSKKLENIAKKDSLTGAWNRFGLDDLTNKSGKLLNDTLIILLDIDDFKDFNSLKGHDLGDLILKETVTTIESFIKSEERIVRYGGDEFVVCLSIDSIPEEFYKNLMTKRTYSLKKYKVTYSMGATKAKKGDILYDKIKLADKAMYTIKDSTKNGISMIPN